MIQKHYCTECGKIFERPYNLCNTCVKDYSVGKSTGEITWRDTEKILNYELMSAMSPIEAKIRSLCRNNDLLGEIIATLSLPQNQEHYIPQLIEIVEVWKRRYIREI